MQVGSIATFGRSVLGACLISFSACGGAAPPIPRVLDEQPTLGVFVSPHQYEWFVRGELALAANDLDAAATAFEQARLGPADDALIVVRLAETELRRDNVERARELVRMAKSLDPSSEAVFLTEGAVFERLGRNDDALGAYTAAIAIAPRSDLGPLAAARLLVALGRAEEAVTVLEALADRARGSLAADRARFEVALAHLDPEAIAEATRALIDRSPGAHDRVVEAANAMLTSRPDLALVLLGPTPSEDAIPLRLSALARARRSEELEEALGTTSISQPEAAMLWLLAGNPARALEALEGATDDAAARCARKQVLTALGRTREAERIAVSERCDSPRE